jgi:hypothetical protein
VHATHAPASCDPELGFAVPAGQAVHALAQPSLLLQYVPGVHALQAAAPVPEYVPGVQALQLPTHCPSLQKVPAGHDVHT